MKFIAIIGAEGEYAKAAFELIANNRDKFLVDSCYANGDDPAAIGALAMEFTPYRLAIGDEYAVDRCWREIADIAQDLGLLDWELPEFELLAGEESAVELLTDDYDYVLLDLDAAKTAELLPAALAHAKRVVVPQSQNIDCVADNLVQLRSLEQLSQALGLVD